MGLDSEKNIERLYFAVFRCARGLVSSGHILDGRLFAVPSVDAELRPSCRIDNAVCRHPLETWPIYVSTPGFDLSRPSGT
jgi:hypothetical protein